MADVSKINGYDIKDATARSSINGITELKFTSFSNQSWTASSAHSSDTNGTYPHRYSVPCTGVTADMCAEVTFGVDSAISGKYSPICECYAGGVYIWATEQTAPTILSILVHK